MYERVIYKRGKGRVIRMEMEHKVLPKLNSWICPISQSLKGAYARTAFPKLWAVTQKWFAGLSLMDRRVA